MIIFVRNGERDKQQDGLNETGVNQAMKRAKEVKTQIQDYCNENDFELSDINLIICSSPFKKCLQTAEIIKSNIESKELKFKKKYDKIFTQYELGDYQHPYLCSAEEVSLDFAGAQMKSVTKETLIDPKQLPQNNYKKENSEQVEERLGAVIYQLTHKLQNSKDNAKQVYIVITHKIALEILVDIFEGSREISESGLISIKFKSDSTFGISFVGKVFRVKEKKQIDQQFEDFQQNFSEDEEQQQEDEEQQEDEDSN
ncbi:unnamed protein product [Paramecium octaurelia]|uniref:Phosphoglycerate mutase n=1 Tax=Paramecium octaurelia TaxID=43137 RepID=A0A8S1XXV0_PAROT|nr:unnamed protein product [Paramecium octaurelia]